MPEILPSAGRTENNHATILRDGRLETDRHAASRQTDLSARSFVRAGTTTLFHESSTSTKGQETDAADFDG